MIVAKQRANPDKAVARLASEIVSKWKSIVEAEKRRKVGGAKPGTASPSKNVDASSPAPPPPTTESDEWKGADPAKRKWTEDGVDIKRTGVPTRDNCVGLLYNGLAFMSKVSPTKVILKAMEVEKAAFSKFKGDTPEYRAKMRSLFQNLKNKQNKDLGPRVLNGEIQADKFVIMTHDELKSAERKKEDDELQKDNMKRAQVPMAERSISDALKCGRCGQKKVSYSQAQTRSADEPMTTFCECTVCGNRWKVCLTVLHLCTQLMLNYLKLTLHSSSHEIVTSIYALKVRCSPSLTPRLLLTHPMDSYHVAPQVCSRQHISACLATQLYCDINTKGILAQGVQVFNPPVEYVGCQAMDVAKVCNTEAHHRGGLHSRAYPELYTYQSPRL